MTTQTEIDALAALLDGTVAASSVTPEIAALAGLAQKVSAHTVVPLPSPAFVQAFRGDMLSQLAAGQAAGAASSAGGWASTAGSVGSATVAAGATSQLMSMIAAVAAVGVLAGASVTAVAPNAAPGDALYDAKRLIENGRLLVGDTQREAELLLSYATERVLEALDLTDEATVNELLDTSTAQLVEALALLDTLGLDTSDPLLADFVIVHGQALIMLLDGSPSDAVTARVNDLLRQTGALMPARPVAGVTSPTANPSGDAPAAGDTGSDAPATTDSSESTGDTGTVTGPAEDAVDDVTDTVGDVVDDVTDTVDDLVDDLVEPVAPAVDGVQDAVDDLLGG